MGVGFLKSNISSIVGQLYPQGDPRRDPGFTLYYYGINLGAFWASIVCGLIGQTVSWGAGFGLAGVGMLAGFLVFVMNKPRLEGHGEPPDPAALKRRVAGPVNLEWADLSRRARRRRRGLVAGAPVRADGLAAAGRLGGRARLHRLRDEPHRQGRPRAAVLAMVLVFGSVVFFALSEQAGTSLNQFTERNTALPHARLLDHHAGADPVVQRRLHPDLRAAARLALGQARPAGPRPQPAGEVRPRPASRSASGFLVLVWAAGSHDAAFRTPLFFLALLLPAADHRRALPEPGRASRR